MEIVRENLKKTSDLTRRRPEMERSRGVL